MNSSTLRAGIARRDITPQIGKPLFGYGNQRPAESIDDYLNATALVLQGDDCTACLISLDLCLIEEADVDRLRGEIFEATQIPRENISISATHTHSGPITVTTWGWGVRDDAYWNVISPRIIEAVCEAQSTLVPVRVGVEVTQTDIGINRREVNLEGNVILGFNEWGPRDRELTVIRLEGEQSTLATVVHVGAHPTSRGSDPAISRDWPGVMIDRVEKVTGTPVLFLNGAFGDVAPRTNVGGATGDGAPAATEVGLRAATDALCAWKEIKEFRELELRTYSQNLELPLRPLASQEEAEVEFQKCAGNENAKGADEAEYRYWNAVLEAHNAPLQTTRAWQQTITRLGPIVFVPFAGEIFSEIALRLKQASPFAHTLCLGTTNGSHGYYVTREAHERGGYEPWVAKAYGAYILTKNIDDVLVQENLKLLQALRD